MVNGGARKPIPSAICWENWNLNLNLNGLLMIRQIDNTSPGGAPGGKLVPGSHKICELGHTVIRHFSRGDQRISERMQDVEDKNSKMSSIPVRKGTGKYRNRSQEEENSPPHDEPENKTTKPKMRYNSREDNGKHTSKPLTRKGLADENDTLKSEIKAHEQRLKKLETMLRLEKDKVSSMKTESTKKETEYRENLDDITKRSEALENRLESYETKLLKCNIDPVTLDSLEPGSREGDAEARYEQTLTKVRLLMEKFREFDGQAQQNIDNLQVMNKQLDEVLANSQFVMSQNKTAQEHISQVDEVHANSQPNTSLVPATPEHIKQLDESNDSVYY